MPSSSSSSINGKDYMHLFHYGDNKSGMAGVDKNKQAQVIYENSVGSSFFNNQLKQDERLNEQLRLLHLKLASVSEGEVEGCKVEAARVLRDLERRRDLTPLKVVIDLDSFFVTVEINDQPNPEELRLKPVAVGGGNGGVCCTANYVARSFGVRSAMPSFLAKKLCPQLIFLPLNFDKYERVSAQMKDIIGEYDPLYSAKSLDEVFFDLSDYVDKSLVGAAEEATIALSLSSGSGSSHSSAEDDERQASRQLLARRRAACVAVAEIRQRILDTTGCSASAGIAHNFMLAKVCSNINKPNGQYELSVDRVALAHFVAELPVRKISGVGKVTERLLAQLGLHTLGEVRDQLHRILLAFSRDGALAAFLAQACAGVGAEEGRDDGSRVAAPAGAVTRKSLSHSSTFRDLSDQAAIEAKAVEASVAVAASMAAEGGLRAQTVTLRIKRADYSEISRSKSVRSGAYVSSAAEIRRIALDLLRPLLPMKIRLLGIAVSNFKGAWSPPASPQRESIVAAFRRAKSACETIDPSEPPAQEEEEEEEERLAADGFLFEDFVEDDESNACWSEQRYHKEQQRAAEQELERQLQQDQQQEEREEKEEPQQRAFAGCKRAASAAAGDCFAKASYTCLVCQKSLLCSLALYNAHLDKCLQKPPVSAFFSKRGACR